MKRIRLLMFLLSLIVGGGSVWAQDWTASEVGTGNYYLYNVGKGQFLTRGNGWGTQASVSANSALTVTLEEYNGAYKLRTNVNGNGKGLERLGDPVIYTDQSDKKNSTWTFTKVNDASNGPVYTIVSADNHGGGSGSYMTANADNTIVGPADAANDDYGRWQLVQSWITNSIPVNDATGWTTSQTPTFDGGNVCAEYWNKSGATIKQTLTSLPAGSYELIAVALTRTGMTATLYAGSNTMNIATASTSEANNRGQAKDWFNAGNGVNSLEFTHAGGNLEIGLTADNTTGDHWLVWRSFVLLYKGLDLSELKAALQNQIDAVPVLEGTTTTAAYNAAKNYADGIDIDALTTEEAISTASTELANLVNAATALQTNYARYLSIKTAALTTAPNTSITEADAAVDAATTNDAIDAAIVTLRAAFLAELPNVTIPNDPGYIDVTAVMVDNPSVSTNTNYWTAVENGSAKTNGSWAVCNYGECEFYNQNFKFYQTLALTPGTWEFGVTGFHRAGNHSTYFYAGDDRILIPGVANSVVNTMAQAKTYFDNGNGKVALKFLIEEPQNVEIGINNQDTETDKWTIFRDFTLKYYGKPDYSVYDTQWNEAVTAANAALSNNADVTIGSEYAALNAAIADEPAEGSKKADYLEKINTLADATVAFNTAAPNYDALAREIVKAKALGMEAATVDAYAATAEYTAATAIAKTQALMVAEYNFVSDNYSYAVNLGTWNASANAGTKNVQHWDGTGEGGSSYLEQSDEAWASNSWTVTYDQTLDLPAGNYVFKVAGRTAATDHVTLNLNVTNVNDAENPEPLGNVNDFPKGDTGLGINKAGETSFDANDEDGFANNGNGRGWQWRYVKFTLSEPTSVKVAVVGEANAQYCWMSFCNATVQTDNQNNVALMEALVALNEAKAAPTLTQHANVGTGVFQLNATTDNTLWTAYTNAKNDAESFKLEAGTTTNDVATLIAALQTAQNAYTNNVAINAPDAEKRYNICIKDEGQAWDGYAVTFVAGGRNDMGNYAVRYLAPVNSFMNQALKFTAVENEVNTYKVSAIRVEDGSEQYITTGSTYPENDGNNTQIRTTEDASKASWVKIQPTATFGEFQLLNVSDGNKVIARNASTPDDGMYTDGNNSFTIAEASQANVTGSIAAGKLATRIFPFKPAAINGVNFYSAEVRLKSGSQSENTVGLTEVDDPQANTPYILENTTAETIDIAQSGWGTASADSYKAGDLTGVYTAAEIAANESNYILQTQKDTQAFFLVSGSPITATPYRAYLTAPDNAEARIAFEFDETTGINGVNAAEKKFNGAVYDLSGRKVAQPTRGLYIVNGKKVVIK